MWGRRTGEEEKKNKVKAKEWRAGAEGTGGRKGGTAARGNSQMCCGRLMLMPALAGRRSERRGQENVFPGVCPCSWQL